MACLLIGSQCTLGSHTNTQPCAHISSYRTCTAIHMQPTNTCANTSSPVPLSTSCLIKNASLFQGRAATLSTHNAQAMQHTDVPEIINISIKQRRHKPALVIPIRLFRNVPAVPTSSVLVLFFHFLACCCCHLNLIV